MHAPAGTEGFAAHTIDVHCALEAGGREAIITDPARIDLAVAGKAGTHVVRG